MFQPPPRKPENRPTRGSEPGKRLRGGDPGPGAAPGLLEELSAALRAGKLVELLTGKGLAKSSIDELLRPESAAELRALLTFHSLPSRDTRESSPAHRPGRLPCGRGKVLLFKAKARSCP